MQGTVHQDRGNTLGYCTGARRPDMVFLRQSNPEIESNSAAGMSDTNCLLSHTMFVLPLMLSLCSL